MTGRAWRHEDAGTPEAAWLTSPGWDGRPVLGPAELAARYPTVVIASAHPDDESLAVGGLIAELADHGCEILLIIATAGEHSHPRSSTWPPGLLAAVRRAEIIRAAAHLAPAGKVVQLGLTDGSLAQHVELLAEELVCLLDGNTLLVAPWTADGHPDHDALGEAASAAASRAGSSVAHYPLWLWHWARPEDLDWDLVHVVEPGQDATARKEVAIGEYTSQTAALGPLEGDRAVVTGQVLDRAARVVEVLLAEPGRLPHTPAGAATDRFDEMYDAGPDPWRFLDSFYETRKRNLALAGLGRPRYRDAIEIGCATGLLTADLAGRCERVTGMDVSRRALSVAARLPATGVTWRPGSTPEDLPDADFDLIVLSEIGYFLRPAALLATLRWARARLRPGGEILLAHWQHPTPGEPLNGRQVHEQAARFFDLPHRAGYADRDVRIDVYGEPASLAAAEGRL